MLLLGMIALGAGLFFKVAAVPFHMWAPDVYEGAPTSVTAFLSTGSKAASFALYARIFSEASAACALTGRRCWVSSPRSRSWLATGPPSRRKTQNGCSLIRRSPMPATCCSRSSPIIVYGYIGLIIYLFVYTLMNMGAFGVIISLRRRGIIGDNVDDLTGLGQKAPFMAAMMAIFMLSLGGLPMTGGFIGKYFLFGGLIQRGAADRKSWYYWLAGWAIINTVVSFYYYLRFIKVMYLGDRIADNRPLSLSPALQTALVFAMIGIIVIGIYPQPFIKLAQDLMTPIASFGAVTSR